MLFHPSRFILPLLGGLIFSFLNAQEAPKAPPAPMVDVFHVKAPSEEAITFTYPAKTLSSQSVVIKARANGILQKKFFTEGDVVKTGDTLYTIEPDSYEAAHNLAKANVMALEVNSQKTLKEWERVKALYDNGASSESEKDAAYFAQESAKASLNAAKASLQQSAINLSRTTIKATMSGVVGLTLVDVGSLVSEGMALVEIAQSSPLHVEFSVPDSEALKQKYAIKNGKWSNPSNGALKVALLIGDKPLKELGVVDYVDTALNAKTGSLKMRATFKNQNKELLANQFVKVNLTGLTRANVIKVPQKAVLQNPLGTVVFVVKEDKALSVPVKIAETSGNDFIIESGITQGDVVIVNNFFKIKNGTGVKIDKVINQEAK